MIVPYPLQYLCGGKHAGRGTLFVMVLLQLWYLIHIFDRNGGDVIVFMAVVSVRESEGDAVEYGEMDWERKKSCTSYIPMERSSPRNRTGVCSSAWSGLRANAQNIRVRR